jgi:hypothetical protein
MDACYRLPAFPVVEGNRLLGIASIKDILWAITESLPITGAKEQPHKRLLHMGLLPKEPRRPQAKSKTGGVTGSPKHRIPTHLESDVSQSDRDAPIGLPFS